MKKINILITIFTAMMVAFAFGLNSIMQKRPSKNTELLVVNSSNDSVLVFLTLSGYNGKLKKEYIQDVKGIFGIKGSGLSGNFYLHSGDTARYTSVKRFSANVGFGTAPINCPTTIWQNGANIFEFNLNVPQESCDIGCVTGVNSIINVKLIGGSNWVASNNYPNVREIENDSMYKNTNRVGVMPYGCTNCVNTDGKQPCQTPSETPDSARICNPTRSAGKRGGKVIVNFKGYTE